MAKTTDVGLVDPSPESHRRLRAYSGPSPDTLQMTQFSFVGRRSTALHGTPFSPETGSPELRIHRPHSVYGPVQLSVPNRTVTKRDKEITNSPRYRSIPSSAMISTLRSRQQLKGAMDRSYGSDVFFFFSRVSYVRPLMIMIFFFSFFLIFFFPSFVYVVYPCGTLFKSTANLV